jgi:hypothetical protein
MLQDAMRHKYLEAAQSNGIPRKLSGDQSAADSAFPSQLSTPSSRSLSPTRCIPNPISLIKALRFLSLPWPSLSLQAPQRTRLWFKVQLIWTRCTACFRAQLKRHVEAGISYLLCLSLPFLSIHSWWSYFLPQDLLAKVKEHEEEIAQLRRHLSDYSVKVTKENLFPICSFFNLWLVLLLTGSPNT